MVPEAATLTQLQAGWQAFATALDGVTDVAITGGRIDVIQSFVGADKGAGAGIAKAGSRVEQTGIVNFGAVGTRHRWGFAIPGLANAKIVAGKLNLTDAAVITLTDLIKGALAGGKYANPNSQLITTVIDALLSFRERRRQLQRTSGERP